MNVINDPSIGSLSRSLGTGLGKSLERLAENKYKQIEERHNIKKATDTGAYSQEDAAFIQSLPEKDRWEAYQVLAQERGATPDQMANNGVPTQMSGLQNFNQDVKANQQMQGMSRQQVPMQQPGQGAQAQGQPQQPAVQLKSFAQRLQGGTPAQRKEMIQHQNIVDKETLKPYQELLKEESGVKDNNMRLNRMNKLIDKGNLPNSTFYRLFKGMEETDIGKHIPIVGSLIGMIANPIIRTAGSLGSAVQKNVTARDYEEFEKLSNDMVRSAKSIFGSRITDQDLKVFMQMIPTLSQTDVGKKAIIDNMKLFNEATNVKAQTMKDLIRENGGRRPANMELLIEQRARPELDRIADEFTSRKGNGLLPWL